MRQIKFRFYKPSIGFMKTDSKTFVASDLIEEEDWKVMQFTGLLDKNGKEIYEGDIIEAQINGVKSVGTIVYIDDWAMYQVEFISGETGRRNVWGEDVIIGNVFENPELLK